MTKANPSKVWTGVGSGGSTGHPTGRMNPGPFLLSKDQLLVMMVSLGLHVHFGQPAPGGLIIMPPKLLHFKQSQKTIPFQQGKSIIIQNTWGNGKIRHSTTSNQSFRFLKRSLLNISGNWRGKKVLNSISWMPLMLFWKSENLLCWRLMFWQVWH